MRTSDEVIDDCLALFEEDGLPISGFAALRLMADLCRSKATFFDASQYVFAYGRHMGYNLPEYPLAGCGEIREFLADQGVRNLPEWYAHIGVGRETYDRIYYYRLLVLVDPAYNRIAVPIAASWLEGGAPADADAWALGIARGIPGFVRSGVHPPDAVLFK